jgi:hypothetical protein
MYRSIFLTSTPVRDAWSASRPGRFTSRDRRIGGWVGTRVSLEDVEESLAPTGTRTPITRSSSP